jgi:hypothetical protein
LTESARVYLWPYALALGLLYISGRLKPLTYYRRGPPHNSQRLPMLASLRFCSSLCCPSCRKFRTARLAQARDTSDKSEYCSCAIGVTRSSSHFSVRVKLCAQTFKSRILRS